MAVNLGSPTFRWFLFSSAVLSNDAVAVGFAAGPIIVVGRAITVIYFNFDNENGSETPPSSPSYSTCNYQSGYCCACSGNAGFKNVVIQPSTPFLLHPPPRPQSTRSSASKHVFNFCPPPEKRSGKIYDVSKDYR